MFEVKTSRSVDKGHIIVYDKKNNTNVKYDFIGRTSVGNGIQGYVENLGFEPNPQNSFSVVQVGENIAQFRNNEWYASQNIFILLPKDDKMVKNHYFVVSAINSTLKLYQGGYSNYPTLEKLRNDIVYLPVKNGEIDFEFMENFVRELEADRLEQLEADRLEQLEADRLEQLEAYLTLTGLKDYVLSDAENQAIESFNKGEVQWGEFRFDYIFNNIQQGRRLKKQDQIKGNIPFIMAGVTNTGLVNYISNPVASFPKNSITIDIFGNAFYRSYDFGAGDDTGVYWNSEKGYSKEVMLFLTKASEKALEGRFSYGKKLRSSQSLMEKMMLPIKDGAIDYEYMELLISAIQKIVIKDVVQYADQKIEITKELINKDK